MALISPVDSSVNLLVNPTVNLSAEEASGPGPKLCENMLAFDTSTELLSIALQGGGLAASEPLAHSAAGDAQASVALIPAIQSLMARAGLGFDQLRVIAFGAGPGSFTGLRTACAVAQGLGFGAGVGLLPVNTLMAMAQDAGTRHGLSRVTVVLDARMGEVYAASFEHTGGHWQQLGPHALLLPQQVDVPPGFQLVGNALAERGCLPAQPLAAAMLRLAPALLARGLEVPPAQALPTYIRDKVAQTTAERMAQKVAQFNPSMPTAFAAGTAGATFTGVA